MLCIAFKLSKDIREWAESGDDRVTFFSCTFFEQFPFDVILK